MDNKKFDNPAEIFFTDAIEEPKKNSNLKNIILSESPEKCYLLKMSKTLYKEAYIKAKSGGRSFNQYVNQLILQDLFK